MAKYVCSFEEVIAEAQNIKEEADNLVTALKNYADDIKSDIASWEGEAQSNFNSSNEKIVTCTQAKFENMNSLGEFIEKAANAIKETDENLASSTI